MVGWQLFGGTSKCRLCIWASRFVGKRAGGESEKSKQLRRPRDGGGGGGAGSCVEAIFMGTRPTHTRTGASHVYATLSHVPSVGWRGVLPFSSHTSFDDPFAAGFDGKPLYLGAHICRRSAGTARKGATFGESLERKRFSGSPKVRPKDANFFLLDQKFVEFEKRVRILRASGGTFS